MGISAVVAFAERARRLARAALVAVVLAATATIAIAHPAAAQRCRCDIPLARITSYDDLLRDADVDHESVDRLHLPFGIPTRPRGATREHALHAAEYVVNYDADLRAPTWVAYRLTAADLEMRRDRTECFRPDPRTGADASATCVDYGAPAFDQGHIVPSADMTRSEAAMVNTYVLTNMAPQYRPFNRYVWAWLEGYVRDWARTRGEVFVISGAVFDYDGDGQRDPDERVARMAPTNRVGVPTHFFKIVLARRADGGIDSMAFLVPHAEASPRKAELDAFLLVHAATVDEIEAVTGVNFLRDLPDAQEEGVESFRATRLWDREPVQVAER